MIDGNDDRDNWIFFYFDLKELEKQKDKIKKKYKESLITNLIEFINENKNNIIDKMIKLNKIIYIHNYLNAHFNSLKYEMFINNKNYFNEDEDKYTLINQKTFYKDKSYYKNFYKITKL